MPTGYMRADIVLTCAGHTDGNTEMISTMWCASMLQTEVLDKAPPSLSMLMARAHRTGWGIFFVGDGRYLIATLAAAWRLRCTRTFGGCTGDILEPSIFWLVGRSQSSIIDATRALPFKMLKVQGKQGAG